MSQSLLQLTKDLTEATIRSGQLNGDIAPFMRDTFATLQALAQQDAGGTDAVVTLDPAPAPTNWKKSITRTHIQCLICGAFHKQLGYHLKRHGLNHRQYRHKFGIPSSLPLASKELSKQRREAMRELRPWEKSPQWLAKHAPKKAKKGTKKARL